MRLHLAYKRPLIGARGFEVEVALDKYAPLGRAVQRSGAVVAIPILSGLHQGVRPDMICGKDTLQIGGTTLPRH
jgi:hypothetical protein